VPSILFAHDTADAEPLLAALKESGWTVVQRRDARAALALAQTTSLGAALIDARVGGESGLQLAEALRGALPILPVVLLTTGASPALETHRAGPRAASACVDRALPPEKIAAEVRRAVRTIPSSSRPKTGPTLGQHAVLAALRELDSMKPAEARLPTPDGVKRAAAPVEQELETARRQLLALEQEQRALVQKQQKTQAEHRLALSTREDMVRHLELALEALTQDLSSAATGLAAQQDQAGAREGELAGLRREQARLQGELATSVRDALELRRELGEARGLLLGAELDTVAAREALTRAMTEASATHQRALEAEAQRADLIRAVNTARTRADAAAAECERAQTTLALGQRDAAAAAQSHQEELLRLRKKLQAAERALEDAALKSVDRASGSS
jgi:DNA-binding response OmpR family regulator